MNKIEIPMNNLSSSTTGGSGGVRTITSLEVEQLQNQLKESLTTTGNNDIANSPGPISPSGRRGGRHHRSSLTHKLRKSISGRFGNSISSSMKDNSSSHRGLIQRGLILVEDHQTRLDDEIKYLKEDLKKLEQQQQQQQQQQEEQMNENKEEGGGSATGSITNSPRHCRSNRHAGGRMSLSSKFSKLSASLRRSTTN